VVAAGLGWMLDSFDVMLYSIVLATLMREFGMTKSTAGSLNTLTLMASALGGFLFGFFSDKLGRRRTMSMCILTYSLFTFACGFSTSVTMLACFRFLLGLGMGGQWNAGATLVAETWPSAWRGRALAMVQSSWAIGYALAVLVANFMLAHTSWRWVFYVGVLPALVTFWIQKGVPEPELWHRSQAAPVSEEERRGLWREATPKLLGLLLMNIFGMFAWWGLFTWLPAYLSLPIERGGTFLHRGFGLSDPRLGGFESGAADFCLLGQLAGVELRERRSLFQAVIEINIDFECRAGELTADGDFRGWCEIPSRRDGEADIAALENLRDERRELILRLLDPTPPKPSSATERKNDEHEDQISFEMLTRSTAFDGSGKIHRRRIGG